MTHTHWTVFSPYHFSRVGNLVGKHTHVPSCHFNKESTFLFSSLNAKMMMLVGETGSSKHVSPPFQPKAHSVMSWETRFVMQYSQKKSSKCSRLIAHPHLLVRATNERFLPTRASFRSVLACDARITPNFPFGSSCEIDGDYVKK